MGYVLAYLAGLLTVPVALTLISVAFYFWVSQPMRKAEQ